MLSPNLFIAPNPCSVHKLPDTVTVVSLLTIFIKSYVFLFECLNWPNV